MNDASLIPFGWSTEQEQLVDVADVRRGRACACVCPACRTPLIARKGDVRQAHFAHAARNVYNDTVDACDYSVFVAARLMLKQIIGPSIRLEAPAYVDCVVDERGYDLVEWFTATDARSIELSKITVEQSFGEVLVDVLGSVGGRNFVVYITYPGRSIPEELMAPQDLTCGILQLRLDDIGAMFAQKEARKSYRDVLMDVLVGPGRAKRWVYHPRHSREKALAEERLRTSTPDAPAHYAVARRTESPPGTNRLAKFTCVLCGVTWEASERNGISDCVSCPGRLCARPVANSS